MDAAGGATHHAQRASWFHPLPSTQDKGQVDFLALGHDPSLPSAKIQWPSSEDPPASLEATSQHALDKISLANDDVGIPEEKTKKQPCRISPKRHTTTIQQTASARRHRSENGAIRADWGNIEQDNLKPEHAPDAMNAKLKVLAGRVSPYTTTSRPQTPCSTKTKKPSVERRRHPAALTPREKELVAQAKAKWREDAEQHLARLEQRIGFLTGGPVRQLSVLQHRTQRLRIAMQEERVLGVKREHDLSSKLAELDASVVNTRGRLAELQKRLSACSMGLGNTKKTKPVESDHEEANSKFDSGNSDTCASRASARNTCSRTCKATPSKCNIPLDDLFSEVGENQIISIDSADTWWTRASTAESLKNGPLDAQAAWEALTRERLNECLKNIPYSRFGQVVEEWARQFPINLASWRSNMTSSNSFLSEALQNSLDQMRRGGTRVAPKALPPWVAKVSHLPSSELSAETSKYKATLPEMAHEVTITIAADDIRHAASVVETARQEFEMACMEAGDQESQMWRFMVTLNQKRSLNARLVARNFFMRHVISRAHKGKDWVRPCWLRLRRHAIYQTEFDEPLSDDGVGAKSDSMDAPVSLVALKNNGDDEVGSDDGEDSDLEKKRSKSLVVGNGLDVEHLSSDDSTPRRVSEHAKNDGKKKVKTTVFMKQTTPDDPKESEVQSRATDGARDKKTEQLNRIKSLRLAVQAERKLEAKESALSEQEKKLEILVQRRKPLRRQSTLRRSSTKELDTSIYLRRTKRSSVTVQIDEVDAVNRPAAAALQIQMAKTRLQQQMEEVKLKKTNEEKELINTLAKEEELLLPNASLKKKKTNGLLEQGASSLLPAVLHGTDKEVQQAVKDLMAYKAKAAKALDCQSSSDEEGAEGEVWLGGLFVGDSARSVSKDVEKVKMVQDIAAEFVEKTSSIQHAAQDDPEQVDAVVRNSLQRMRQSWLQCVHRKDGQLRVAAEVLRQIRERNHEIADLRERMRVQEAGRLENKDARLTYSMNNRFQRARYVLQYLASKGRTDVETIDNWTFALEGRQKLLMQALRNTTLETLDEPMAPPALNMAPPPPALPPLAPPPPMTPAPALGVANVTLATLPLDCVDSGVFGVKHFSSEKSLTRVRSLETRGPEKRAFSEPALRNCSQIPTAFAAQRYEPRHWNVRDSSYDKAPIVTQGNSTRGCPSRSLNSCFATQGSIEMTFPAVHPPAVVAPPFAPEWWLQGTLKEMLALLGPFRDDAAVGSVDELSGSARRNGSGSGSMDKRDSSVFSSSGTDSDGRSGSGQASVSTPSFEGGKEDYADQLPDGVRALWSLAASAWAVAAFARTELAELPHVPPPMPRPVTPRRMR